MFFLFAASPSRRNQGCAPALADALSPAGPWSVGVWWIIQPSWTDMSSQKGEYKGNVTPDGRSASS